MIGSLINDPSKAQVLFKRLREECVAAYYGTRLEGSYPERSLEAC